MQHNRVHGKCETAPLRVRLFMQQLYLESAWLFMQQLYLERVAVHTTALLRVNKRVAVHENVH